MKVMVFDVGGTEIKYSVMDEQMHRTDSGTVPTPQDTQAQFLDTVYRLYAPHRDEVTGIAMALPGFVDNRTGVGGGISKQPLLLESLRSAYDWLFTSRAGQAYMEGLLRCQIVPCAFSSEANQVGVAAAYFEAMQKKC